MDFSSQNTRKARPLVPEGTHMARCFYIVDLGTQNEEWEGKFKTVKKSQFGFEFPTLMTPIENPGDKSEPFIISKKFTHSLGAKSTLLKFTEPWFGRTITEEERKVGIPPSQYIGRECMITVIHKKKQDGTLKAEISGIMALPTGIQIPPMYNKPIVFDIGKPDQFQVFPNVYSWLREDILKSPEFLQECARYGVDGKQLHQQAKDAWKAANPQNNQQVPQHSAMQPNQQWMQQGQQQQTVPGYGQPMQNPQPQYQNPAPQQYQQPSQTGFGQQQQMPPAPQQTGFGGQQQAYQQPAVPPQPQYQQPANVPPGYQQPQQYPQNPVPPQRTMDGSFGQPQASPAFGHNPIQGGFGQSDPNMPF